MLPRLYRYGCPEKMMKIWQIQSFGIGTSSWKVSPNRALGVEKCW